MPAEKNYKIYLVSDFYWPGIGGIEQWVKTIAANLSRRFEVIVITHALDKKKSYFSTDFLLAKKKSPYHDEAGNKVVVIGPEGIQKLILLPLIIFNSALIKKYFARSMHDFLYFFYKKAFFSSMAKLIKDAWIVHCFSTGYLAACITDLCVKNKIQLIHSPPVHFGKWGDTKLLLESYSKADRILCLSRSFETEFRKLMPYNNAVINAVPVPVPSHEPVPEITYNIQKPYIFFLGRRDENKGLGDLVSAFEQTPIEAILVIAGPGEKIKSSDKRIMDMGVVDENKKRLLIAGCTVFCVPSKDESFGIVYAEAMANAKPVIAYDIAPVNEIVINGITGILSRPGDISELAKSISHLLNNSEKSKNMGNEGYKKYCELYKEETVMEYIIGQYESATLNRAQSLNQ
jgi:glycosyltransferase involved in cell wall biosynthesis